MSDESRWWLRGEHVIDEGNAGRKDHDGQELRFFDVLVDSTIMVESLQPVRAGALKRLGATVSPDQVRDLTSGSAGLSVMADFMSDFKDFLDVTAGDLVEAVFIDTIGDLVEKWKRMKED